MDNPEQLDGKVFSVGGEHENKTEYSGHLYSGGKPIEGIVTDAVGGWPDPWPQKGITNKQWADQLLDVVLPHPGREIKDRPYSEKQEYLTRALDIACMYSERPVDRYLDQLMDRLGKAVHMIDSVSMRGSNGIRFSEECRTLLEQVREYRK